jgi:DNA-directed RNA polymerase specialized sigma24 family protein
MEENRRDFWAQKSSEYRSALNRYFRRQVSDPADAEDLAQEVYLRLLRVEQNATIQNPEAYLYTIAVNLLRERAALSRRQGLNVHLEDVDESLLGITASAEDEIDHIGRERNVEEAVSDRAKSVDQKRRDSDPGGQRRTPLTEGAAKSANRARLPLDQSYACDLEIFEPAEK